jgi:hypothetical protein
LLSAPWIYPTRNAIIPLFALLHLQTLTVLEDVGTYMCRAQSAEKHRFSADCYRTETSVSDPGFGGYRVTMGLRLCTALGVTVHGVNHAYLKKSPNHVFNRTR